MSQRYKNPIWVKLRPCGTLELARRDPLSLPMDSILVSSIISIDSRPPELDPGIDRWRQVSYWRVALDFPGYTADFLLPGELFSNPSTSPKFSKIPFLPRSPCISQSSFSTHVPVPTLLKVSLLLSIFCWILLQFLALWELQSSTIFYFLWLPKFMWFITREPNKIGHLLLLNFASCSSQVLLAVFRPWPQGQALGRAASIRKALRLSSVLISHFHHRPSCQVTGHWKDWASPCPILWFPLDSYVCACL